MIVSLKQGLITARQKTSYLFRQNNNIDLIVNNNPILVIFSHGVGAYLIEETESITAAWQGPFSDNESYWFYWDIDTISGKKSFGITKVKPTFGDTLPSTPSNDQHFFDKNDNYMKVWNGSAWIHRIRVFAGSLINGELSTFGKGSQADLYGQFEVNEIRFHKIGSPIIKELDNDNYIFVTNSGNNKQDVGQIENLKYERVAVSVIANQNLEKSIAVTLNDSGKAIPASYTNINKEVLGITETSFNTDEQKNIITKGFITDRETFNFSEPPNFPLFIDENGNITSTIPTADSIQKIGYIISPNTIFVDIQPQILII